MDQKTKKLTEINEIKALLTIQHEHIVKFIKALKYEQLCFIVMEYVPYNLMNFPNKLHLEKITLQLVQIVRILHSYGIIHGDINCRNVLINKDGNLKVVDFGGCRLLENSDSKRKDSEKLNCKKHVDTLMNSKNDRLEVLSIGYTISKIFSLKVIEDVCNESKNSGQDNSYKYFITNNDIEQNDYIYYEKIAEIIFNCIKIDFNTRYTLEFLEQKLIQCFVDFSKYSERSNSERNCILQNICKNGR